jgi:hypothetical protein
MKPNHLASVQHLLPGHLQIHRVVHSELGRCVESSCSSVMKCRKSGMSYLPTTRNSCVVIAGEQSSVELSYEMGALSLCARPVHLAH